MKIEKNKVVSINYTLTNTIGETLDSSEGRGPLNYIQGLGHIIMGLEEALEGKKTGEKLNVTIAPDKAYGIKDNSLVQQIPRSNFDAEQQIEPGMQFRAQGEDGTIIVTVTSVDEETVTVDANHPLAGETLTFDVEIVEIRDASAEEIAHGHVH